MLSPAAHGPRLRSIGRAAPAVLTALASVLLLGADAQGAGGLASLVVATPGIRDAASNQWVGIASQVAPTRDRWVIQQQGVKTEKAAGKGEDRLSTIPADHVITLPANVTPDQVRSAVAQVAAAQHATVIVDMDLQTVGIGWKSETQWTATVVQTLAEEHLKAHPETHMAWIGHSAGTEPMHLVEARAPGGDRPLFDDIYALSPRSPAAKGWPDRTVMVVRDGDFVESPGGYLPVHSVLTPATKAYIEQLAADGHRVIRETTPGLDVDMGVTLASGGLVKAVAAAFNPGMISHTVETEVATPDRTLIYYAPNTREPVPLGQASLIQGLKTVTRIEDTGATSKAQLDAVIRSTSPTPGLGGISLSPLTIIPIRPGQVAYAACCDDRGRLYLHMADGLDVAFTPLPLDIVRAAYELAYVRGEKAELSIGGSTEESPTGGVVANPHGPGQSSVYYFGHTRDTLLGLAMYQADSALGEISFGNGAAAAALSHRIPGYRSLPELFPEKYAHNPTQGRYLGNQLIFLDASSVHLSLGADGRTLTFEPPDFAIRFARSGPAEEAYASFAQSQFVAIAAAPEGKAFAQLVPYVEAIAVFRWLKAKTIRFEPGYLGQTPLQQVYTPSQDPTSPGPEFRDVAPPAPTVFFGPFGPRRVIDARGHETLFDYDHGRLVRVRRADGARLEVLRDGLGAPLAVTVGDRAAAFYLDAQGGLILARDVALTRDASGVQVRFQPQSAYSPISNPEVQLASIAFDFAAGQEVLR